MLQCLSVFLQKSQKAQTRDCVEETNRKRKMALRELPVSLMLAPLEMIDTARFSFIFTGQLAPKVRTAVVAVPKVSASTFISM